MSLAPGSKLGPYEIVAPLGAGGMGEVYRARDTKLDREVAIKILPESFANDPDPSADPGSPRAASRADRLMRFEREAKTLASLNHPNIAQLYGIEERALVMELVEGDDLSVRIGQGAMPLDVALPIAQQIADALEAAHAQGIVHRDLKPANIKVKADGVVKVLDFGLAKALEPAPGVGPAEAGPSGSAESPTMTSPALTSMGLILGTAAYMAPEQARGRTVDHRADIWAFGVVLAEMLTGRHAFKGEDITETLAAVVKSPPRLDGLAPDTPEAIRRLLRRCLEKDPRKRLSSIADARLELDDAEAGVDIDRPAAAAQLNGQPSIVARFWPALAGVVATLVAVAAIAPWNRAAVDEGVTRTTVLPPTGITVMAEAYQAAISPDGTMVAMTVQNASGGSELWLRDLESAAPRRLDVGGANQPFWKPDSSRIGFFTFDGKLKTIAVSGGRADELCDAWNPRGATWSASDVIVFAPDSSGPLYRVPATGGACEPVTSLDETRKQDGHRFPTMLPDDEHFLYAALPRLKGQFDIFVGSLLDDSTTFVASLESAPVFAEPGWLLFARQEGLAAQAFDAATLTLSGTAVPLDDEPAREWNPIGGITAAPVVSISRTGTLVYTSALTTDTTVVWHDQQGRPTGTFDLRPGRYESVAIAPDGVRAIFVRAESSSESRLWLADLSSGNASPLRTGPGWNDSPVWSPEGDRVVFASDRDGPQNIYVIGVGDTAEERLLHESDVTFRSPNAWSSGPQAAQWIVVTQQEPQVNLWLLSPASGEMKPFLTRPFPEAAGRLDPTGQWLAYLSAESGRMEVYLQSFPEPGQKVQVTRQGAFVPTWLADGRLLFRGPEQLSMWEVPLGSGATQPGTPRQLATFPVGTMWIEPLVDGRFLSIVPESSDGVTVTLVRNWLEALPGR